MNVADFFAAYPSAPAIEQVTYDPLSSAFVDAIDVALTLTQEQKQALGQNGFVVLADEHNDFRDGYHRVYDADLPVFVTTDSILYALHWSFDAILQDIERGVLIVELERVLESMHEGIQARHGSLPANLQVAAGDLDVYLAVARSLLSGAEIAPVGSDDRLRQRVETIMAAIAALQPDDLDLFGAKYAYDFSQMKPRGHYENEALLQQYFRAMMWLGRTDLPIVTFDEQGNAHFNRTALDGAYLIAWLLDETEAIGGWTLVNSLIERMIGERDSMDPRDMQKFVEGRGLASVEAWAQSSDDDLFDGIMRGRYGIQRIMSQIMYTNPIDPPVVLPRVFHALGQRFTIDSYVFNNVTYDRVQDLRTRTKVTRMLPSELDVQFVLGSNDAADLLRPELEHHGYHGVLHELRYLVDAHPTDFWESTFYNGWLAGIRALNQDAASARLPEAMRTRAWRHKTLNTQAASWAELRHDTLLYVKQSYSGGITCEYPDGYVEPAPQFFANMQRVAQLGAAMMQDVEAAGYAMDTAEAYFAGFAATMATLHGIAENELADMPLTGEQVAFLAGTIEADLVGCGEVSYDGWYPALYYPGVEGMGAVIADVHTAPTDEHGIEVGWVLHAATGPANLMVVTVPSCDVAGATAYVGPVSSYYSVLTENFTRLADSEWQETLRQSSPPRPTWTADFVK